MSASDRFSISFGIEKQSILKKKRGGGWGQNKI